MSFKFTYCRLEPELEGHIHRRQYQLLQYQVAIALNIREPEVARFYVEYWNLVQHHSLGRIYDEIKDDIGPFVNLYT